MQRENDKVIQTLDYDKKVMAEEVLHANGEGTVRIVPVREDPKWIPPKEFMEPIIHRDCGEVAFYYTHRLEKGEAMVAARARNVDGKPIERGSAMRCGSCGALCGSHGDLYMRPKHGT